MEKDLIAKVEKALITQNIEGVMEAYHMYLQYLEESRPILGLNDRKAELLHFKTEYQYPQIGETNNEKILAGLSTSFYLLVKVNSLNSPDFIDFRKDGPAYDNIVLKGETKVKKGNPKKVRRWRIYTYVVLPTITYFLSVNGLITHALALIWGGIFTAFVVETLHLRFRTFVIHSSFSPLEKFLSRRNKFWLLNIISYQLNRLTSELIYSAFVTFLVILNQNAAKKIIGEDALDDRFNEKGLKIGIFHLDLIAVGSMFVIWFGIIVPLTNFDFAYYEIILTVLFILYFSEFIALGLSLYFTPICLVLFAKYRPKHKTFFLLVGLNSVCLAILMGALNSSENSLILNEVSETLINFFTFNLIKVPILNIECPGLIFGGLVLVYIVGIFYRIPKVYKNKIIAKEILDAFIKQGEPKKALLFLNQLEQENFPIEPEFQVMKVLALLGDEDFDKALEIYENIYKNTEKEYYSHLEQHPDKDLVLANEILEKSLIDYFQKQEYARIRFFEFVVLQKMKSKYEILYFIDTLKQMSSWLDDEPVKEWLPIYQPIFDEVSFDVEPFFTDYPTVPNFFRIIQHPLYVMVIEDKKMPHFYKFEVLCKILSEFYDKIVFAKKEVRIDVEKAWDEDWKNFLEELLNALEKTDYFINIDRGNSLIRTLLVGLNYSKGNESLKYITREMISAIESKLTEIGISPSNLRDSDYRKIKAKYHYFMEKQLRKLKPRESVKYEEKLKKIEED